MPSLLLSATQSAPHISGSRRAPIGKPALRPPTISSPSTYPVHDDCPAAIPSDSNANASGVHTNIPHLAARRMHNALQPISRLNSDILEHLFLTGASLAAIHGTSFPSSSSTSISLTRTILTYAHLTSSLRQTALRSARLWALLLDFERASPEWNAELLRRSNGVSLQLVWQWSKAAGSTGSVVHTRSRSESTRRRLGLQEWVWEGGGDRTAVRERRRREDRSKRARLEDVLQRNVLERARSLGFAVPAPYFASVLLGRLGARDVILPELESLRIVKSRPKSASASHSETWREGQEEDEEESDDGKGAYIPLGVIANAPRLRRLAIAECNLAFHDLIPSSSVSSAAQSIPDFASIPIPPSATLLPPPGALHTLHHLHALQIADLPLRTAPTAREWLRYLTFMPALEELVLEGAVLRRIDLTLRDNLKAGSGSGSDGAHGGDDSGVVSPSRSLHGERRGIGEREAGSKGIEEDVIDLRTLPKLRVLTLDAALEDVAVFAAHLPLPSRTTAQGRRQMRWTLLCADADTSGLDDVETVMNLFASAVGGGVLEDPPCDRGVSGSSLPAGLGLSIRATEPHVYVHLSVTAQPISEDTRSVEPHIDGGTDSDECDANHEAGFSIYVNLHSVGGGGASSSPLAPSRTIIDGSTRPVAVLPSSTTLLSPVLAALANTVLPHVANLELDLGLASTNNHSAGLTEVLCHARAVEVLTLGSKAAKGVLRMLLGEQHKRSLSIGSESSFSSSSSDLDSSPSPATHVEMDPILLPAMKTLHLNEESAAGPTWTALLRFVKARVEMGVPVRGIVFSEKVEDPEWPLKEQFVRMGAVRVPEGRVLELERMGLSVAVIGR